MRRLYFKLLRFFNNGEPSLAEAGYAIKTKFRMTDDMTPHRKRAAIILNLYTLGEDLKTIADKMGVSHERIRQIIRKACRELK